MPNNTFIIKYRSLIKRVGGNLSSGFYKDEVGYTWIREGASQSELQAQLEALEADEFGSGRSTSDPLIYNRRMNIRRVTREEFIHLVPEMEDILP